MIDRFYLWYGKRVEPTRWMVAAALVLTGLFLPLWIYERSSNRKCV